MLGRLWRDRRGSYTVAFGISGMTLVLAAGGTTDMMRYLDARAKFQDAVDRTALIVATAHKNDESGSDDDTAKARDYLSKAFDSKFGTVSNVTATTGTNALTVRGEAAVGTYFLKIGGINTLTATAQATTTWSASSLEIALVLDNTGSMLDNGKLSALKSAATSMVNTISAKASSTYTIKFSLVPFSNFVKVGSGYKTATWIDQGNSQKSSYYNSYFSSNLNRWTIYSNLGKTWPGCVESRPAPYDVDDTAPNTALPDTLFVPALYPDEPDGYSYSANSYVNDQSWGNEWTRLVNAQKYVSPSGQDFSNQTLYSNFPYAKGPGFMCSVQPLQRLTTDYASVKTQISNMVAVGSTNIPEGMAWGWRTLSPKGPFADGTSYADTETSKIIVMLTDGTNSINTFPNAAGGSYSSWGYPVSNRLGTNAGTNLRNGLDAKTREVCTKAKAAGIKVYTIGLMIDDSAGQQLLSDCSSGASYYYNSPSASQLQSIFDDIAKKISKLRISS